MRKAKSRLFFDFIGAAAILAATAVPHAVASPPSAPSGGDIAVVGLDDSGDASETLVAPALLTERLSRSIALLHDSAVPALRKHGQDKEGWRLRVVVIGTALNLEAGVGPLVKVSATPRFRILFSNQADPAIP